VAAHHRTAKYGDAWFPYFVEVTPAEVRAGYDAVRASAATLGRDPETILLACCRPIEVTPRPVPQDERFLRGSPEQLLEALQAYQSIGVSHMALQFMTPRWPDRVDQIDRFALQVLPHLQG
jgi:alkanesulfonate monooxygenase SsuD/methylene tetrahydromethanopterin reductase-like flavin-dependent oxidoreductase (luciferase family)